MLQIKGIEKTSLIDYPGYIASILFLGGCNFRCDYCYNKDLVLRPNELPNLEPQDILSFLEKRNGFIDGVVITGGEPTLQTRQLIEFLPKIKALGLKIKLDTNGYFPQKVRELLDLNLINYLAMDIKAPLKRYSEIAGVDIMQERIAESIKLIMNSGVEYEFRTTVWKGGFTPDDYASMFETIRGAGNYYLQNMYPVYTIQPQKTYEPMTKKEIETIAESARKYVQNVHLRGNWL